MSLEDIILYCFKSGEAMRYSTLYHLLRGKKTTSVLSFGRLYQILDFFHLFPKLSKDIYDKHIATLIHLEYLEHVTPEFIQITNLGKEQIKYKEIDDLYIKEYDFYKVDEDFWLRLLFISQVISYKSYGNKDYFPIDNDPIHQQRVKEWLTKYHSSGLVESFYNEWHSLLSIWTVDEQEVIISRLVGDKVIGLTLEQLSFQKNQSTVYLYLIYKSGLHKLLKELQLNPSEYPLMVSILRLVNEEKDQDSVDLTEYLFKKGHSISEIAKMRRLKESTITDHFIELYVNKGASELVDYISEQHLNKLYEYKKEYPNYKVWKYTDMLSIVPDITFYEFKFFQFILLEEGEE